MNNNPTPNLNNLFQTAQDEGLLSQASMQALNVIDLGAQIQAGLGVNVDDVTTSEVVLVTIMPDDSGSILLVVIPKQFVEDIIQYWMPSTTPDFSRDLFSMTRTPVPPIPQA